MLGEAGGSCDALVGNFRDVTVLNVLVGAVGWLDLVVELAHHCKHARIFKHTELVCLGLENVNPARPADDLRSVQLAHHL